MAKSNPVRGAKRLCADSRDLIERSATLILGSGVACAVFMEQIAKTKAAIVKSRNQMTRHLKSR